MEQMSTCCKHSRSLHCFYPKLVGRAGWFGRLSDSISVYIGPSPRKREKRRELTDERKRFKQLRPAPIASTVGPYPTIFQTSKKPRHWKFTEHHRATRPTQGRPGAESYTMPSPSPTDHPFKKNNSKMIAAG